MTCGRSLKDNNKIYLIEGGRGLDSRIDQVAGCYELRNECLSFM